MRQILILFSVLIFCVTAKSSAQTPPVEAERASEQQATAADEGREDSHDGNSHEGDDEERLLKQRKLEIGMILTSGIVVLGVFLVVLTLLYGRRTRRQMTAGRGVSAQRDELWYLKKTPESDGERPGAQE